MYLIYNSKSLKDELFEEGKLAGLDRTIISSIFDDISALGDDFVKIKTTFRTNWLRRASWQAWTGRLF